MNCKPGDLAYIVEDGQHGASNAVGLVVEVMSAAACSGGPGWIVRMREARTLDLFKQGKKVVGDRFRVADAWLRPISGVPVTDEVTNDIREPA